MFFWTALQKQGCGIKVGHCGGCTWSQMRSHFFSLSYCRRRRALSGGRFIEFWKTESAFASEHIGSHVFLRVPMATTLQRRLCARFLWVTVVSTQTRNPAISDLTSCADFLYPVSNLSSESDIKEIFVPNSPSQTIWRKLWAMLAFAKLTATIVGDCQGVAMQFL